MQLMGHVKCTAILFLQHSADINAVDKDGNTAISVACIPGLDKCLHLLTSHGTDANISDKTGNKPIQNAYIFGKKNAFHCYSRTEQIFLM